MGYIETYENGSLSGWVSIVDPLGRDPYDYLNLEDWATARESALGGTGDLSVSGYTEVAECRGGGNLLGPNFGTSNNGMLLDTYFSNHSTFPNPRRSVTIRAERGHECGSTYDTSKCHVHNSGSDPIYCIRNVSDDYIFIEGIWASGADRNFFINNSDAGHVSGCVSVGREDGNSINGIWLIGDEAWAANCIVADIGNVVGFQPAAYKMGGSSDNQYMYNCSTIRCYRGLWIFQATAEVYSENCYWDVDGEITNDDSGWIGHTADITSDGNELPQARSGVLATDCYENIYGPTWDFSAKATSPLIGEGHDLSPSASGGVIEDIDRLARPQGTDFDVGAVEAEETIPTTQFPDSYIGGYVFAAQPFGPKYFGAYLLSRSPNVVSQVLGGYLKAQEATSLNGIVGGYLFSLDLTPVTGYVGAGASGLNTKTQNIGAYSFGAPEYTEYAETHARTLSKAFSEDVADQVLNIDATVTFKQINTADFNSRLDVFRREVAEFYARLKVEKYRTPPTLTITSVTPESGVLTNGAINIQVTASGSLGDGDEFVNTRFDFGDPDSFFSGVSGYNTPGPIWTSNHTYHSSGIYVITARAVDNLGMVGSDAFVLNLASGLNPGEHYPYLQITAAPRSGEVPPSLFVQYTASTSGSSLNGKVVSGPTWDFGNRERGAGYNEQTYYHSPGLYAPKCTLKWRHNNESDIWVSDTLLLGYNR